MKKAIFITLYSMLVLGCLVFMFHYGYSMFVNYCYNQGIYSVDAKPLQMFNWTEKYIAYYNQGNIYYQEGKYVEAVDAYDTALKMKPPKGKECAIRVNEALAMLATIGDLYQDPAFTDTVLQILYEARNVLLEDDCATEDGDGHSKEAEQLKKEIDDMIKEVEKKKEENQQQNSNEQSDDNNSGKDEEETTETSSEEDAKEQDAKEQEVKAKIKEKQTKANDERRQQIQNHRDLEKDYNFDSDGIIW